MCKIFKNNHQAFERDFMVDDKNKEKIYKYRKIGEEQSRLKTWQMLISKAIFR